MLHGFSDFSDAPRQFGVKKPVESEDITQPRL